MYFYTGNVQVYIVWVNLLFFVDDDIYSPAEESRLALRYVASWGKPISDVDLLMLLYAAFYFYFNMSLPSPLHPSAD